MDKSITSWDDIPSLELEMKDSTEEENKTKENRSYERINSDVLKGLLYDSGDSIPIKLAKQEGIFDGNIEDLSQRGIRVCLPNLIEKGDSVRIGFVFGSRKIVAKAMVIWANKIESGYIGGLEFVDLNQNDADFILSLNHAVNFNKAGRSE